MQDTSEPLAEVRVTALRRYTGVAILFALGVTLLYVATRTPPVLYLQIMMIAAGIAAFFGARGVWRASGSAVILTREGLRDADGTSIAPLDQIELVDGGFFAFRPSNGFTVRLRSPMPAKWRPGLWWRLGRRIGVGGMTPRQSGKFMVDMLAEVRKESDPPGDTGRVD
jgi:hypothetical protein